ncbi:MAG: hypothetical protein ABR506_06450 [Candidatus Krumholzibacteriia bacterium]
MKKIATAAFLLTLVLAHGYALAQMDPDDDGIGIYFDPCACVNCVPMEPGPQQGYIVITHPTSQQAGVGGWEAKIWVEGPGVITNVAFEGNAINFASRADEYIVGIQIPLYNPFMYPAVIVATIDFLLTDDATPLQWYIDAVYFHSAPEEQPAYLDGDDYNIIIPLQQPTGGPTIPVATINGDCAVPTTEASWGGVKSLYR